MQIDSLDEMVGMVLRGTWKQVTSVSSKRKKGRLGRVNGRVSKNRKQLIGGTLKLEVLIQCTGGRM